MTKKRINEAQFRAIVKKSVNEALRRVGYVSRSNAVNESLFGKIKDKINDKIKAAYPEGKPKSIKEVIAGDGYKVYNIVEKNADEIVIAIVNGCSNSFIRLHPLDFDDFIDDLNMYFQDNGKQLHAEEVDNDDYEYYGAGSLIKISKLNTKQNLKEIRERKWKTYEITRAREILHKIHEELFNIVQNKIVNDKKLFNIVNGRPWFTTLYNALSNMGQSIDGEGFDTPITALNESPVLDEPTKVKNKLMKIYRALEKTFYKLSTTTDDSGFDYVLALVENTTWYKMIDGALNSMFMWVNNFNPAMVQKKCEIREQEGDTLNPFYAEEDSCGETGRRGQVRSYELGISSLDEWRRHAEDVGMSLKEYVEYWFSEVNDGGLQFLWQTLYGGYGYHGDTLNTFKNELTGGTVVVKDIYGQLMLDEYCPEA